jgi:hypothetical protein
VLDQSHGPRTIASVAQQRKRQARTDDARVRADEQARVVRQVPREAVGRRLEVALVAGEVDKRHDLARPRYVVRARAVLEQAIVEHAARRREAQVVLADGGRAAGGALVRVLEDLGARGATAVVEHRARQHADHRALRASGMMVTSCTFLAVFKHMAVAQSGIWRGARAAHSCRTCSASK